MVPVSNPQQCIGIINAFHIWSSHPIVMFYPVVDVMKEVRV